MGLLGLFKGDTTEKEIVDSGFEISQCQSSCEGCGPFPSTVSCPDDDQKSLWLTTKPYGLHCIVSTGKTDWQHDATDAEGTLENAVDKWSSTFDYPDGKIKVSVSSLPVDPLDDSASGDVLILPFFVWVRNLAPTNVDKVFNKLIPELIKERDLCESKHANNKESDAAATEEKAATTEEKAAATGEKEVNDKLATSLSKLSVEPPFVSLDYLKDKSNVHVAIDNSSAYVFLCSHKTRDKRCGITGPIMRKEFEVHLRDLDKYRDINDHRPDGVRIAFVNHVGGHKYAANVLLYLKNSGKNIWLARCSPSNVKPIIDETILHGRVWPEKVRIVQKFKGIEW